MVHKKYIKKGGKVFGPYLYENYREKGITKTRYLGKGDNFGGKNKKNPRNLQVNLLVFAFIVIFVLLILGAGAIFIEKKFSLSVIQIDLKGMLSSQNPLQVFIRVVEPYPEILNVSNPIYVCENTYLSSFFNVSYGLGTQNLEVDLIPKYPIVPFYVDDGADINPNLRQYEIFSPFHISKNDISRKRTGDEGWAVYHEGIFAQDKLNNVKRDSEETDIVVLEVNNPPKFANIGARTIWVRGENKDFYYKIILPNEESPLQEINFSLYFLDIGISPFFNINAEGIMNVSGNESLVDFGSISKVYNLRVCTNDTGLKTIHHPNIDFCLRGYPPQSPEPKGYCGDFSLTVTRENRPPKITSFNPEELLLNASGNDIIYFNISGYDPDGTIPDVYWEVDEQIKKLPKSLNFTDVFDYSFGCGISGEHRVKAVLSDGLLNSSVQWNFSVSYASCSTPTPSSGGSGGSGGGGSAKPIFCDEKWVCKEWSQCKNLLNDSEAAWLDKEQTFLVKERCGIFNYDGKTCGFQKRACFDAKSCKSNIKKPGFIRECYFTENPTCADGIKNCHNETCEFSVDCGGPCKPCPTCSDNIKNQDEKDVDCGGVCKQCVEKPLKPVLLSLIILYSFIIIIVIILILVIKQVADYKGFKKIFRKNSKKNLKVNPVTSLVFIAFILVLLFFANGFIMNIADIGKSYRIYGQGSGILASQGLMGNIARGFAKFFLTDVILVKVASDGDTVLAIGDETKEGVEKSSICENYCLYKTQGNWNVHFYANYTEAAISIPPPNGNCQIRFDDSTGWGEFSAMNYNTTSLSWEYNRSFNYRGSLAYEVSCTSSYHNLAVFDNFFIVDSPPRIMKNYLDYIDFDLDGQKNILQCSEDIPCYYDFSKNVTEDDYNDLGNLFFGYINSANTTLTNFTIDSASGMLFINISDSRFAGNGKKIELSVKDSDSATQTALLEVNIRAVNDAPVFVGLGNKTFNATQLFEHVVLVVDEENNTPFALNISFLSCETADWSDRKSLECELFNEFNYSFNPIQGILNISFIPTKNDAGSYIINFTVVDNSSLGNASSTKIIDFTVRNINEPPSFTYICDNERIANEDIEFKCRINASDPYELNNLTFSSDKAWFLNKKSSDCNFSNGFNSSIEVSFIALDTDVGNWTINISVIDTGEPVKINSTVIEFFVNNKNDAVYLPEVQDFEGYSGNEYSIKVNASDDDLKIPASIRDNVYRENLSFYAKDLGGNEIPWLKVFYGDVDKIKGISYAYLNFSRSGGTYSVNLSSSDKSGQVNSTVFTISILGNSPPEWNPEMVFKHNLTEDSEFYLDLSQNASDADGDTLVFSARQTVGEVPSFSLSSQGIVQFTPIDVDVGFYSIEITASDGKTPVKKMFNFTISNVDDLPVITKIEAIPLDLIDESYNIIGIENNETTIVVWAEDDDMKIPEFQKQDFYNEDLNLGLSLEGPNSTLFDFIDKSYVRMLDAFEFHTSFIPRKYFGGNSDIGDYNITINVSDKSGAYDVIYFNLTVTEVNNPPILMNFTRYGQRINRDFYLDINSADLEDINDSFGKIIYSYGFLSDGGADFINGNENIFNIMSGEIRYIFTESAKYHLNITATDSGGLKDFGDFWIYVYETPIINYPTAPCNYALKENHTDILTFRANHSAGDNLTYDFYLSSSGNDSLKARIDYYGNNSPLDFYFTPNFTDESYGDETKNLTLLAYPLDLIDLNASLSCSVKIEHTNAPVEFIRDIGDKSTTYKNILEIDLKDYFLDIDFKDSYWKQKARFRIETNSSPSSIFYQPVSPNDWILRLYANSVVIEKLNISVSDLEDSENSLTTAVSNNFEIEFSKPVTETVSTPVPSSGGGGGSSSETIISLKLIMPGKISAYENEKIIVPLTLINNGKNTFNKISLNSSAFKDGSSAPGVKTSLDKDYFESLNPKESKNISLTLFFGTNKTGDYEVMVNLASKSPEYKDWGKIHINLQKINESSVRDLIVFTEELIVKNPQCIEIKELINEAKVFLEKGDIATAKLKSEEAVSSCEKSILQVSLPKQEKARYFELRFYMIVLAFAVLISIIMGIFYYLWKIRKLESIDTQKPKDENKYSY